MKNILLAVTGLAPQVITETLYALRSEGREIHEIHIITTRRGCEEIYKDLLAPKGIFQQFINDFKINSQTIRFSRETIYVLHNKNGHELDDIVTIDDNEALFKLCLERTFFLTSIPEQAVFFLIAGGRKTMSACLSAAAQFYGRPQDRVYHVLVTPEFESCRNFWYPRPQPQDIEVFTHNSLPCRMSTSLAQIQLVPMPFVSMRDRLTDAMLTTPQPPAELMAATINDPKSDLIVNLAEGKLIYGKRQIDIHTSYLALYGWFAKRKKQCPLTRSCHDCRDCFVEREKVLSKNNEIEKIYSAIPGSRIDIEMSDSGIIDLSSDNFQSYKSKLRKSIIDGFGSTLGEQLVISSHGNRPDTKYGILLDKERIRVLW